MIRRPRLLVCDLDNTLYDWVGFFVPSFYAMVDAAVEILRCDREELLSDLQHVHQQYHDAEHPFALLETRTVQNLLEQQTLEERRRLLDPAFRAFNSVRKKTLRLYPGVRATLEQLTHDGVKLVAHSESRLYSVMFRMKFLSLTEFFEKIYCLQRPVKTLASKSNVKSFWTDFPTSKLVELSHHQRKPNPDVLGEMFRDFGVDARETAYIGDSIARDVYMAKQIGSVAIWAKYGSEHDPEEYKRLIRISHWSPEEIGREVSLKALAETVQPDFVARNSFQELLSFFD